MSGGFKRGSVCFGERREGGFVLPIRASRAIAGQNAFTLKTRFIVNLRSGRAARRYAALQIFAARHGAGVVVTERSRHAHDLAVQAIAENVELIVAVGGDGTMNEVAGALLGKENILGLVPCGSGDGLGRHLGIHGSLEHACDILLHGAARTIDSGVADGHPFFTAAGIGIEAEIAHEFNQLTRRGFARYLSTALRVFRRYTPQEYVVTHQGRREQFRALTLAVGNSDQYGNNARIAPDARADDGQLDLCALPPLSIGNALPLAVKLFRGTIGTVRGVNLRRGERFVVERPAPGPLHTDGEVHAAGTSIEFAVRPGSLRVMCPRG